MNYLVDTNILIWIIRGEKYHRHWFDNLKSGSLLHISTLTIAEIYKNVFPSELSHEDQVIQDFDILDVTAAIAK